MFIPFVASAQTLQSFIAGLLGFFNNVLVPLIFSLALLFFLWNVFRYFILKGATPDGREKAKRYMIWSIIGLVLMVSIWGIVNLLINGLGIREDYYLCPDYNPDCFPVTDPVSEPGGRGGV